MGQNSAVMLFLATLRMQNSTQSFRDTRLCYSGKSSLMNLLLRREAAIVTPMAGTTRDVIDGVLNVGGYPVRISDTAGLRDVSEESVDPVER